jgi:Tol biopolymer transport system component
MRLFSIISLFIFFTISSSTQNTTSHFCLLYQTTIDGVPHYIEMNPHQPTEEKILFIGFDTMPALSPDGDFRAFVIVTQEINPQNMPRLAKVSVMNINTGEIIDVTTEANILTPVALYWSPDSQKIAFTGAFSLIYVVDRDGGLLHQLTDSPTYRMGSWSPDSQYIGVTRYDLGRNLEIIHVDTGEIIEIASNEANVYDDFVTWTPDSRGILFNSNRMSNRLRIHYIDIETREFYQFMDYPFSSMSWNLSGTFFVYQAMIPYRQGHINRIFSYDWLTGETQQYAEDINIVHENFISPTLSPDGLYVIFEALDTDGYALFMINLQTDEINTITFNHHRLDMPIWTPCSE